MLGSGLVYAVEHTDQPFCTVLLTLHRTAQQLQIRVIKMGIIQVSTEDILKACLHDFSSQSCKYAAAESEKGDIQGLPPFSGLLSSHLLYPSSSKNPAVVS